MVFDILDYIKCCPYLSDYNMNIDFLGKNPYSLSVSGRSKDSKVRAYTDGDSLVKSVFTLRLRLPYGIEMEKNTKNSELLKNISDWLLNNSAKGVLPELDEDKIPISVSAEFLKDKVTYLADTAVFNADIAILYYKTKSR